MRPKKKKPRLSSLPRWLQWEALGEAIHFPSLGLFLTHLVVGDNPVLLVTRAARMTKSDDAAEGAWRGCSVDELLV